MGFYTRGVSHKVTSHKVEGVIRCSAALRHHINLFHFWWKSLVNNATNFEVHENGGSV